MSVQPANVRVGLPPFSLDVLLLHFFREGAPLELSAEVLAFQGASPAKSFLTQKLTDYGSVLLPTYSF